MARSKPQASPLSRISIRRGAAPVAESGVGKAGDLTRRLAMSAGVPPPAPMAAVVETADHRSIAAVLDAADRLDFSALPPRRDDPEMSTLLLLAAAPPSYSPPSQSVDTAGQAPRNGHKKNRPGFSWFKPPWPLWWH